MNGMQLPEIIKSRSTNFSSSSKKKKRKEGEGGRDGEIEGKSSYNI